MELSEQNNNVLSFLNKLDVDVKQFPERTFDGLFENVPEESNFFFSWFMENVGPDNALTQSEQATYFQLKNSQSLCNDEEINYVLSSCNPTFEELVSLDVNYINNFLSEDLDELEKILTELSRMKDNIECSYNEVKRKQNSLKEMINAKKRYLNTAKESYLGINSSFGSKVKEVKLFLLEEQNTMLDFDLFCDFLPNEESIHKELEDSMLLENDIFKFENLYLLNTLMEDLRCAEISVILSEGFLRLKRGKRDYLSKMIENKTSQKGYDNHILTMSNTVGVDESSSEEVKVLESELFEKLKTISHYEVQNISNEYLLNKLDLNTSHVKELTNFKDLMKSSVKINSCLLHILLRNVNCLEKVSNLRKQLFLKLKQHDTIFSKDVTNFELRKQRFKEVTAHQHQNPLLVAMKNVIQLEEIPENNEETLKKVVELVSHGGDDSSFITHGFRNGLQLTVKLLCDTTLCGPTSQLQYVPAELLVKLQDSEEWESKLSQVIKRVVNKYVDAKATVSKGDRKMFLLWTDFLVNPLAFLTQMSPSPQSKKTLKRI